MKEAQKVYVLLYTDPSSELTTSVLGVFASLQDANDECFSQARAAGVTLESESSTMGSTKAVLVPVQPARWDVPEGTGCWVEAFDVTPKRIASPG